MEATKEKLIKTFEEKDFDEDVLLFVFDRQLEKKHSGMHQKTESPTEKLRNKAEFKDIIKKERSLAKKLGDTMMRRNLEDSRQAIEEGATYVILPKEYDECDIFVR